MHSYFPPQRVFCTLAQQAIIASVFFDWACENGFLTLAQWLCGVSPVGEAHVSDERANGGGGRGVGGRGRDHGEDGHGRGGAESNEAVLQGISEFSLLVRGRLGIACAGGLEMAQWFVRHFRLQTKFDFDTLDAFMWTCEMGHFNLARWLVETFKLGPEDVDLNFVLRKTCGIGLLEFAQWLDSVFHF